jgi:hypothetical protein
VIAHIINMVAKNNQSCKCGRGGMMNKTDLMREIAIWEKRLSTCKTEADKKFCQYYINNYNYRLDRLIKFDKEEEK